MAQVPEEGGPTNLGSTSKACTLAGTIRRLVLGACRRGGPKGENICGKAAPRICRSGPDAGSPLGTKGSKGCHVQPRFIQVKHAKKIGECEKWSGSHEMTALGVCSSVTRSFPVQRCRLCNNIGNARPPISLPIEKGLRAKWGTPQSTRPRWLEACAGRGTAGGVAEGSCAPADLACQDCRGALVWRSGASPDHRSRLAVQGGRGCAPRRAREARPVPWRVRGPPRSMSDEPPPLPCLQRCRPAEGPDPRVGMGDCLPATRSMPLLRTASPGSAGASPPLICRHQDPSGNPSRHHGLKQDMLDVPVALQSLSSRGWPGWHRRACRCSSPGFPEGNFFDLIALWQGSGMGRAGRPAPLAPGEETKVRRWHACSQNIPPVCMLLSHVFHLAEQDFEADLVHNSCLTGTEVDGAKHPGSALPGTQFIMLCSTPTHCCARFA